MCPDSCTSPPTRSMAPLMRGNGTKTNLSCPTRPTRRVRQAPTSWSAPITAPTVSTRSPPAVRTTTGPTTSPKKSFPCLSPICWTVCPCRSTATGVISAIGYTSTTTVEESRLCCRRAAPARFTTSAAEPNCPIKNSPTCSFAQPSVTNRLSPMSRIVSVTTAATA